MKTVNVKSQREKIILNYFAPHKSMDVVDMYSWLDPGIIIHEPEQLPWGGSYHGLKGVGEYMTNITRSIISEIVIEEIYTCGEKVVTIGRSNGKVKKTGIRFDIRVTQLFTFNEANKVARVDFLSDLPAFLAVLQANLPAP